MRQLISMTSAAESTQPFLKHRVSKQIADSPSAFNGMSQLANRFSWLGSGEQGNAGTGLLADLPTPSVHRCKALATFDGWTGTLLSQGHRSETAWRQTCLKGGDFFVSHHAFVAEKQDDHRQPETTLIHHPSSSHDIGVLHSRNIIDRLMP